MASYPTSVKTFSARSNGQTIDQSWFNDLQDEVTAIEDGLLNGTAPLNSSRSTVVALSVTGASTLGTVQAGASTLASLSVSGASTFAVRPVAPAPHLALVYAESTHALGSSAASTLQFTGQSVVTNSSMHSTSTPDRIVPQSTGVYRFTAQMNVNTPSTLAPYQIAILDSSGTLIGVTRQLVSSLSAFVIQATGIKRYDVTGGHAVVVFTNASGGNSTASLSTGSANTWFLGEKL